MLGFEFGLGVWLVGLSCEKRGGVRCWDAGIVVRARYGVYLFFDDISPFERFDVDV